MARNKSWCNPDNQECLDALIKEINDDLTVGCQIPFTVPKVPTGINAGVSITPLGVVICPNLAFLS